ncbi:FkbM family methyltransferase [Lusitaniella coriacea]|uniref:FkbM family methyltransferase n=1 Tax=Lusitaniella coriacea TaxID=1983105 RepID=UPI003CF94BAA
MEIATLNQIVRNTPITPVKNSSLLRLIDKVLPLGHRLYFLIEKYARHQGLLNVPWGKYRLLLPSGWLGQFSMHELIFKGKKSTPELAIIQNIIEKTDEGVFVDVGAAIGLYLLHLRQYSNQPIIAYEPSPLAFAICQKNIDLNQLPNVDLRNKACGNTTGLISMEIGINSRIAGSEKNSEEDSIKEVGEFDNIAVLTRENWTQQKVDLIKLDEDLEAIDSISFIKIDCEGFEFHILQGAIELIKKHRPTLFVELHPQFIEGYGYTIKDVCELLKPYYRLEYWDFQQARKMSRSTRFLSYYFPNQGYQFTSEAEMLDAAKTDPIPTQLYLLAYPK